MENTPIRARIKQTFRGVILAFFLGMSGAACVQAVDLSARGCPCGEGWRCCEVESVCVPEAEACPAVCGNGAVESGEECDGGAGNGDNSGCTSACRVARCGDGLVYSAGEACDDGGESRACDGDCTLAHCGDGRINTTAGERCDDGNEAAGDYCAADCGRETGRCGDGVRQSNEECDAGEDGTTACGYGEVACEVCGPECRWVAGAPSYCGDGEVDGAFEECDDGNLVETDSCLLCVPARCGDGVVREDREEGALGFESCDGGGENSDTRADACRTTCERPRCGDGVVDRGEYCDDDGERCSWDCGMEDLEVTAGATHSCATADLSPSGEGVGLEGPQIDSPLGVCWGALGAGPAVASEAGPWRALRAGDGFTCGLRPESLGLVCDDPPESTLACWGESPHGVMTLPPLTLECDYINPTVGAAVDRVVLGEELESLGVGRHHACGLLRPDLRWSDFGPDSEGREVRCWGAGAPGTEGEGAPHFGQAIPGVERASVLAAGGFHTCALVLPEERDSWWGESVDLWCEGAGDEVTAALQCWGDDRYGQLSAPSAVGLVSIVAGGYHTCGLNAEGEVVCWGAGEAEELMCPPECAQSVPPSGVRFRVLTAGDYHTCGITDTGAVQCWGAGLTDRGALVGEGVHRGQSRAPLHGRFLRIAAGRAHTCGVTAELDLRCWGSNDGGQLNAPAHWQWEENP